MEMTKQRKMLIGVLCLGLGGLVVDRLLLGPPQSASADDAEPTVQVSPALPNATAEPAEDDADADAAALPSYASLTERLIAAQANQAAPSDTEDRNDPFRVPQQWQADKRLPQPTAPKDSSSPPQRITRVFKLDGTVRTVINGQEEMMAVISGGGLDGRAVRIGQRVRIPLGNGAYEEYELVDVGPRYVVWKSLVSQQKTVMQVDEVL